jgi:hypothetical protein
MMPSSGKECGDIGTNIVLEEKAVIKDVSMRGTGLCSRSSNDSAFSMVLTTQIYLRSTA